MNGLTPNCIDDFIFSNPAERDLLKMILARKQPFPLAGKSGILLHGIWGTGKTTLAQLLPDLIEVAYEATWDMAQGVGQMSAPTTSHTQTKTFRCGGGLSGIDIKKIVEAYAQKVPIYHQSGHDYFVIDEMDRLTAGAQQSLRTTMDLKRCMFFCTTNNLSAIDQGVINRCHVIEMNQATDLGAYLPLASTILTNMGVAPAAIPAAVLTNHAKAARGSMRNFVNGVVHAGSEQGGSLRL